MHSCPICGQACYCSGDCEDHDTGDEFADVCTCCIGKDDADESDFDDSGMPIEVPEPCGDCDPCLGGRPDQCAINPAPASTPEPNEH